METLHTFYVNHSGLFGLASFLATIIPVLASLIYSRQIRRQQKIMARPINLVLVEGKRRLVLPYVVLRSHLNRAELMGILGNYYGGPERFDPAQFLVCIESPEFNAALVGKKDELEIPCRSSFYDAVETMLTARKKT